MHRNVVSLRIINVIFKNIGFEIQKKVATQLFIGNFSKQSRVLVHL